MGSRAKTKIELEEEGEKEREGACRHPFDAAIRSTPLQLTCE